MYPRSILKRSLPWSQPAQLRLPGMVESRRREGERRVHWKEEVEEREFETGGWEEEEDDDDDDREDDAQHDDDDENEQEMGDEEEEEEEDEEDGEGEEVEGGVDEEEGQEDDDEGLEMGMEQEADENVHMEMEFEGEEDETLDLGLSHEDESELDYYIRGPEEVDVAEGGSASWLWSNIDPRLIDAVAEVPPIYPEDVAIQQALENPNVASNSQAANASDPITDPIPDQPTPVEERKRIILYATPPAVLLAMETWIQSEMDKLPGNLSLSDCWLHPTAANLTHNHIISKTFTWTDICSGRRQSLSLQFGTVALLLAGRLTDAMKHGYVDDQWHLSHLCGNWTCCNYTHFTVEPGAVNVGRNRCFRSRRRCWHCPRCMKDKKLISARLVPEIDLDAELAVETEEEDEEEEDEDEAEGEDTDVEMENLLDDQDIPPVKEFGPDFFVLDDV